jgi:uncharacterized protein
MPALQPHLKQLEQHLAALPEEAMLLSELDGYLAGILVCPDLILPSAWLPPIWGVGDEETAPVFDSADDVQALVGLIMRHYNALSRDLQRGRGRYVPIFEVDPRHDETLWELWMSGFERAMTLRPESWARVLTSDDAEAVAALTGMQELIRISSGERDRDGEDQATVDDLTQRAPDLIPPWIAALNAWRVRHSGSGLPTSTAPSHKLGRNDPCPCGSGKKYKKCCGLN